MKKYLAIVSSILIQLAPIAGFAAAGSLDSSFGPAGTGIVHSDNEGFNIMPKDIAVQKDGKILVVGYREAFDDANNGKPHHTAFIRRYLANGLFDSSFGDAGEALFPLSEESEFGEVGLQSDGKIVVAGSSFSYTYSCPKGCHWDETSQSRFVTRLHSDGSLDAGFGVDGFANALLEFVNDLHVNSQDKILLAGEGPAEAAILRMEADGKSFDAGFGNNGLAEADLGFSTYDYFNAVKEDSEGRIVAAGVTVDGDAYTDGVVARFSPQGQLDTGFGDNASGIKTVFSAANSYRYAYDLAFQSDGKILVSSYAQIARLLPTDGSLDSSFGSGGIAAAGSDDHYYLFALANGSILSGGDHYSESSQYFYEVQRYKADGSLDAAFGSNGAVVSDIAKILFDADGQDSYTQAMALQADGKALVAGYAYNANFNQVLALARYLGNTADLSVEIVATGPTTYTLTATNHGPDAAGGVVLSFTLPDGASLVSISSSQGSCSGNPVVTCNLGTLENGASAEVDFEVNADILGQFESTVSLRGEVDDPDLNNNSLSGEAQGPASTNNGGCQLSGGNPAPLSVSFYAWSFFLALFAVARRNSRG